jgi:hypothetical protein
MIYKKTKMLLGNISEVELGAKQGLYQTFGNDGDGGPLEQAIKEFTELMKREPNQQELIAIIQAQSQKETAYLAGTAQVTASETQARATFEAANINAGAIAHAAEVANDPVTLDINETVAYELIKKTGILTDEGRKNFEQKIAEGDKGAKKDALELEKALSKAGYKTFTVDGAITDKTVYAAKALIGENTVAINNYEQTLKVINEAGQQLASQKVAGKEQLDAAAIQANAQVESALAQQDFGLEGDAKVLLDAYKQFSKNGITADLESKMKGIDEVLENASIQFKDGKVIITDDCKNSSVEVSGRG